MDYMNMNMDEYVVLIFYPLKPNLYVGTNNGLFYGHLGGASLSRLPLVYLCRQTQHGREGVSTKIPLDTSYLMSTPPSTQQSGGTKKSSACSGLPSFWHPVHIKLMGLRKGPRKCSRRALAVRRSSRCLRVLRLVRHSVRG
ncbi:hypothetical protein CEXT_15111 [Caerostris extrusa]|uniref:Uncharacterized protein n=1 Tax=Caerostris extrusa TaxID=172846 RepID=A0AAV4MFU4_CAEEX|nr:hypothetical protein CEXT_15111 [Caerostris extrusa]